ncbi:competence/damage-inducible protein A [Halocalculus aciditolerans]|uniref:Competence damage-inducible protein A n=1 Tax=Halocalculus aciditolerans TaxID=1383812 RepID=A0A830FIY9_9EURY|nr:molybdopterin-binding protein [Halocalculus aciditolerans]GGL59615.1 competence damage-inducible protein A [Halocalculus aciditolerans]
MDVAVVTVGDELLSGDTANTNATWLGRRLTERGATVRRVTVVPDDVEEIAATVRDLSERYDAVVVTGGLGPTHDDVTMDGVAAAFDRDLTDHPDAAAWFAGESDYTGDLAPGTTHLPEGARMLPNEVGVAPGCVVEHCYVLPGVPAEMEAMFDRVAGEFTGERRHVETVYVDAPESALVDAFDELRERFDVGVGSYPGDGVRVKIQSVDAARARDAAAWFRERVDGRDEEPSER